MKNWHIHHGDCILHMLEEMKPNSMDMAIMSVPFPSMFAYTSEASDMGNTDTLNAESRVHFRFFYKALARIMKPGRVACVHVMQIPRMKRTGEVGLNDFRGLNIRIGERAGLVYEYDWCITKNPQAQAIRTRSRELQFAGLESDRAKQRGTLGDYLVKFRAPGENETPIVDTPEIEEDFGIQVSRNQWIEWAEAAWTDIRETNTLNVKEGKGEDDTKHICPLQLDVIERAIRLYSNPGETVFSPFTGIGSEGFVALKAFRKFYGCEIKDEYVNAAKSNLSRAEKLVKQAKQVSLFEV